MELQSRVLNAKQQAHELNEMYDQLNHRINQFIELQESLGMLKTQLLELRTDLETVQISVTKLQKRLPEAARKEELEQLSRKINAIPFERLATRKDL